MQDTTAHGVMTGGMMSVGIIEYRLKHTTTAYLMMTVSSWRSHKRQQVLQPHLPQSTGATVRTVVTDTQR